MLLRIVRMSFQPDQVTEFLSLFNEVSSKIRGFEGCHYLKLMRDKDQSNILVTYSHWESQAALDAYRHSALFADTWAKTKVLFNGKPVAYSLEEVQVVA